VQENQAVWRLSHSTALVGLPTGRIENSNKVSDFKQFKAGIPVRRGVDFLGFWRRSGSQFNQDL